MGSVISSKDKKLSNDTQVEIELRDVLSKLNLGVSAVNKLVFENSKQSEITPYGRALFSLLEELTGDVVSRGYVDEKLGIIFEDEK